MFIIIDRCTTVLAYNVFEPQPIFVAPAIKPALTRLALGIFTPLIYGRSHHLDRSAHLYILKLTEQANSILSPNRKVGVAVLALNQLVD